MPEASPSMDFQIHELVGSLFLLKPRWSWERGTDTPAVTAVSLSPLRICRQFRIDHSGQGGLITAQNCFHGRLSLF